MLSRSGSAVTARSSRWSWVVGRIRVPRTGQGSRRQGVRLPREPCLSAQARHRRLPKPDTAYCNESL